MNDLLSKSKSSATLTSLAFHGFQVPIASRRESNTAIPGYLEDLQLNLPFHTSKSSGPSRANHTRMKEVGTNFKNFDIFFY